jgi:hypothetical protein
MATAAPDPFDEDLARLLSDPAVIARLERVEQRRTRGDLVTHSHEEVLARLVRRGVRRSRSADDNAER